MISDYSILWDNYESTLELTCRCVNCVNKIMKCRTVQSRSFSQQVFQFILRVLSGRWQQRYGKFWTEYFEEFVPASLPRMKDFAAVSKTSLKVATVSRLVFTLEDERFHVNFFL